MQEWISSVISTDHAGIIVFAAVFLLGVRVQIQMNVLNDEMDKRTTKMPAYNKQFGASEGRASSLLNFSVYPNYNFFYWNFPFRICLRLLCDVP